MAIVKTIPCYCKDCKYNRPEMALTPDSIWCNYWGVDPKPEDWCCKATPREDI